MFGIFTSELSKARHDAKNWLHLADKVVHYRRDQLSAQELHAIHQAANDLRNRLTEKADAAKLKIAMERLEGCLRRSGGSHYPKSGLADNLEFILVAAILFLGIRAFFVQPFKIPTNSMWPTYFGMTAEVFETREEEPSLPAGLFRKVAFGASSRRIDAPVDGELSIVYFIDSERRSRPARPARGRKWGIFPAQVGEVVFLVGEQPVSVLIPAEFDGNRVISAALASGGGDPMSANNHLRSSMRIISTKHGSSHARVIPTGRRVKAGERVVSFDILTGDQLFVDRMSYHFVRPEVGDSFVFRTIQIKGIDQEFPERYVDRYYIKRLVGMGGDKLDVRPPVLYRNGEPISGAAAFEKNAHRADGYTGYTNAGDMTPGTVVDIPPDSFYAMGDNSSNSSDSRYWGFVPAEDVVGRPLFVYYPFTRRWGPAR